MSFLIALFKIDHLCGFLPSWTIQCGFLNHHLVNTCRHQLSFYVPSFHHELIRHEFLGYLFVIHTVDIFVCNLFSRHWATLVTNWAGAWFYLFMDSFYRQKLNILCNFFCIIYWFKLNKYEEVRTLAVSQFSLAS